jgi:hypothetical protein
MMRGGFAQAQAPLAPDNARQLFNKVLLGRPVRAMLGDERIEQRAILLAVFPRQNGILRQQAVPQRVETGNLIVALARLGKGLDILRDGHDQNSLRGRCEVRQLCT